jgi:hypothetical protein
MNARSKQDSLKCTGLVALVLLLATLPKFFDIYRNMAFNTTPRDDYAPYLLYVVGETGGRVLLSPHGYRVCSVLVALPAYYMLPVYQFTNLGRVDRTYLRAVQAMAFTSYLFMLGACLVMFLIARVRFHASPFASLSTCLCAYVLFDHTATDGIDSVAILLVGLLAYVMHEPIAFAFLVILSTGFNEKVPLLFLVLFLGRVLAQRSTRGYQAQLTSSALAAIAYFLVRLWLALPGNEHQTTLAAFAASLLDSARATLSGKGLILNILPTMLILLLYYLAVSWRGSRGEPAYFQAVDLSVVLGLLLLAFLARVGYNVGRIVMYSFPLLLPPAICFLEQRLSRPTVAREA